MTTFHPFPRLPLELREQIWKDTAEPRTVDVRRVRDRWSQRHGQLASSTPIPAILQSCREARNLKLYKRVHFEVDVVKKFENNHAPEVLIEKFFTPEEERGEKEGPKEIETEQRYTWLDLDIDMLDIGTSTFCDYISIASAVKRLKFERDDPAGSDLHELMDFVSVDEIHIVCPDGFWLWAGALYNYDWPCAEEKLVFIEPFSGRVARGMEFENVCRQDLEDDES
ncbi:hypothetical protein J4E89_007530 [Alternaria sp. Ai002NY15]|nr:hypothetical protein J4E89_007530 [Alternaria sp. Ai002NY15]